MKEAQSEEISKRVENVLKDYEQGRDIDVINIYNKPDKEEVRELVRQLFRIVFPGYFKNKAFKIYNPKNSMAQVIGSNIVVTVTPDHQDWNYRVGEKAHFVVNVRKSGTLLDMWLEDGYGLLHGAGSLNYLWQEHLSAAE